MKQICRILCIPARKADLLRLLALALFILLAGAISAAVHSLGHPIAWLHAGQAVIYLILASGIAVYTEVIDPIGEEEEN